jgi:hypothetical protein
MTDETRGWIYDGAPIVVLHSMLGRGYTVTHTKIKKVATKSFSVESDDSRFRLETLHRSGGYYNGTSRVVHPDDPRVAELEAQEKQRKLLSDAKVACYNFLHTRDERHRLLAIAALQAVQL